MNMPFKFFPKDIKSGKAEKPGDEFVVEKFFGGDATFKVDERVGDTIMALFVGRPK